MLKNDAITLKPLSVKDTDFILELRNNLEIAGHFFSNAPLYDFEHNNWLKTRNKNDLDYIIIENKGEKRVGRIYITQINYKDQKGEYGVVLNPDYRGKGIAYTASSIVLNYVFNNLPIQKISLKVFDENLKAIKLYKKLGFLQEGLLRKEIFKNGVFKDVCQMALFKEHWIEKTEK